MTSHLQLLVVLILKVLLIFNYCVNTVTSQEQSKCDQRAILPKILLTTLDDPVGEEIDEFVVLKNGKPFVLNCSYPQPIDWKFEGVLANTITTVDRNLTYDKFWDWTNPCFSISLVFTTIQEEITGNYKCFHIENEREFKSITVFGGHGKTHDPYLINRGKVFNITVEFGQTTVNFPCGINHPSGKVQLLKENEGNQEWIQMPDERIIKYDLITGFEISLHQIQQRTSVWGIYRCKVIATINDSLVLHLNPPPVYAISDYVAFPTFTKSQTKVLSIPSHPDSHFNFTCVGIFPTELQILNPEVMQVSSKILYEKHIPTKYAYKSGIFITYSGSENPLSRVGEIRCLKKETNETIYSWKFEWTIQSSIIGLQLDFKKAVVLCHSAFVNDIKFYYSSCETLTECQFRSKCLNDDATRLCSSKNESWKLKTKKWGDSSTTLFAVLPQTPGQIRCHSPDLDTIKSYYFQAGGSGIAEDSSSWKAEETIAIKKSKMDLFQVGDTVTVDCWLVQRFFVERTLITITWENDSVTEVPQSHILNSTFEKIPGFFHLRVHIQILETTAKQISCLGLYPDIVGSRRATHDISVRAGTILIMGKPEEFVTISSREPWNLTCIVESISVATITWNTPPKARDLIKFHEDITSNSRRSTLIFSSFDSSIEGAYECVANTDDVNWMQSKKKFDVKYVEIADSTGMIIGITVGVILFILLTGIGVHYGLRCQKRISGHQRSAGSDYESPLTEKDISDFRNGNFAAIAGSKDTYVIMQNSPYDTEYDILKEHLELDQNKVLGMGAYGMVMKGTLRGGKFQSPIDVAVKTVKPDADAGYIKALLTEVKVMIYVGQNKHIIELVGACTQNLSERQLYIVLRLCQNGGLDNYLRSHRDNFESQIVKGRWDGSKVESMYVNTTEGTLFTADLIRWSYQIASGMEYLASKKVIHGDLATRNILLDEHLSAKISDFGLARQMYEYTQYVKKQQAPLPWRWMAIESLMDMAFSTESDVWSFGITLWEIMTLAETPYPGLTWNPQFITTLLEGYRMSKPKFAPSELYDIMLGCWREKPVDRNNFVDLKDEFLDILETHFQPEYVHMSIVNTNDES